MTQTQERFGTPRARRKQDRRQAIVAVARASFLEQGYAGTSMSGLLKTLGGSKATLWAYFRSKEDLFAAVMEDVSASFRTELEETLATTTALEDGLIAFCRTFIDQIGSPQALATWRLVVAESGRFPEVGCIFYDRVARHPQALLAAFLAHHIETGALRAECPARMADILSSLCTGRQTRLLCGAWPTDAHTDEAGEAERLTSVFLRAYAI